MCLLIVSKGSPIPWAVVEEAAHRNKDGFGLSYFDKDKGKMHIFTTLKLKEFKRALRAVPEKTVHMAHLRFGTIGKLDKQNCHPFRLNDYMAFAHNGHVAGMGDKKESDSRQIAEVLAHFLGPNAVSLDKFQTKMLQGLAGDRNKFAVASPTGITLFNSHLGKWDEDKEIWYSDKSYCPDDQPMVIEAQSNGYWNLGGQVVYNPNYRQLNFLNKER